MEVAVKPLTDHATLLGDWRVLFERAANPSVFNSPEWIGAWMAGAPDDVSLWSIRGEANGATVLLGVAGGRRVRRPPMLGPLTARLHEVGRDDLDRIYVEYNDFLLSADAPAKARDEALAATLDAIPVEEFVLRNARREAAEAAERVAAARGALIRRLGSQPTFAADLVKVRASGGDYLQACSASLRSQIRRSMRLYEKRGPLSVAFATSHEERSEAWVRLIALHGEAWRRRGEASVFDNASFRAFHERLLLSPDRADLAVVRAGETIIGCLYNLICGKRISNYQSGFLFEDDNQLKPGLVSHALAIQQYLERGHDAYDFLAGDAEYKRRLGEEGETLTSLVIETRRGVRSEARRLLRAWRGGVARARETRRT